MADSSLQFPLNFFSKKPLEVKFSELDLSSDAGVLLVRQAEEQLKICEGMADCFTDNRDQSKVKHPLNQLISQRVYQIAAGYEDANDSNYLRQDPIFKLACNQVPIPGENLLASQPTMSLYFPVLINEASSGYPLVLQLRAGNSHPGKGVAGILRWLFWRLKKAMPGVRIILRGDAGFSLPEILNVCERSEVKYAFGFSSNAVLKRKIDYLLDQARLQYFRTGEKARLFDDVYYAAGTWNEPRRVIMKAEWLEKGANPRFVVTNLETDAQELYDDFSVQRGASSEHRIKELKLGIKADRLSCEQFIVNQFRLFLSQAAYILMLGIRQAAQGTRLAKAQVSRLRETVIKTAAKVSISVRRVLIELAVHCPFSREINLIAQRLSRGFQLIFS